MWTVKFRDGQMKRFKFAIRTTPWGSIEPHHDLPAPDRRGRSRSPASPGRPSIWAWTGCPPSRRADGHVDASRQSTTTDAGGRHGAPETEVVECDVLIVGGGMAGCGAAYEAAYWAQAKGLRVVLVEKAAIERSGAVAMGLSAINCYMGMKWGENQPEDFVRYVRQDLMGLSREDLVYDIARNVDSTVHMFEEWGLPFFKTPEGRYKREGRWQVMIHGESYKPIVAEAAKKAIGENNIYERVFMSHILLDKNDPGKVAGALGFSVRDNKIYVFKAKAVISAAGGATMVFRPHSVGEGLGRIWYAPWNTGSAYKLMISAGAEMTQMEHRLVRRALQGRLRAGRHVVPAVQGRAQERLRRDASRRSGPTS